MFKHHPEAWLCCLAIALLVPTYLVLGALGVLNCQFGWPTWELFRRVIPTTECVYPYGVP